MYSADKPMPVLRLKDGFNLRDLIDNNQTEFEVRHDELDDFEKDETSYFKYEEVKDFINNDCLGLNDNDDKDNSNLSPFEVLKKKMFKVDTDGKVMKLVKTMGTGKIVPENAVVYIHYNAYTELDEIPYDVTFLRNKEPVRFVLGAAGLLPGLEIGIKTMKKSEKAQFLINPELAYKKMGCPPRIPPDSTILIEVELVRFSENPYDEVELSSEEKHYYSNVIKHVIAEYKVGLNYCTDNNPKAAALRFKKALGMLQAAHLQNEEEEKQQKKYLLKLYSNLAACFSQKNNDCPEKVCIYVTDAIRDCQPEANNHAKLQKYWGKALFHLNEFRRASRCLCKAKALDPNDTEIPELLRKLEAKQKQYLDNEKISCQRMFGFAPKKVEKKEISETMAGLKEQLEIFKNGKTENLDLPPGITTEEEKFCMDFAKSLGLYVRVAEVDHVRTVHITKPSEM